MRDAITGAAITREERIATVRLRIGKREALAQVATDADDVRLIMAALSNDYAELSDLMREAAA